MDRSLRILIFVILALIVINFIMSIFEKSQLRDIQRKIEASQTNIDSAINNLNASRAKLDSMQRDIENFKLYIKNIQTSVAILNATKELEEAKANSRLASKVKGLRGKVAELKLELNELDSLPEIEIKP